MSSTKFHALSVPRGHFEFGKNWLNFLNVINEDRISIAVASLKQLFGIENLNGKRFLDIGSGSGLFSLAASRLGAEVHSFDYDPDAVACTRELKQRFQCGDAKWTIDQGSILDRDYILSLEKFDLVYSWGVLHHTGQMWKALENAQLSITSGGFLAIAIYNDQGGASRRWAKLKKLYNESSKPLQLTLILGVGTFFEIRSFIIRLVKLENPFKHKTDSHPRRGMSVWHDLVDWTGGYPFEVAKPEEIFDFYRAKGFNLIRLKTCGGGLGCNEYVFQKQPSNERPSEGKPAMANLDAH